MGIRKSQVKAVNKYTASHYFRPAVLIKKEYEAPLRAKAESEGKTLNAYITDLIKKDLGITETEN